MKLSQSGCLKHSTKGTMSVDLPVFNLLWAKYRQNAMLRKFVPSTDKIYQWDFPKVAVLSINGVYQQDFGKICLIKLQPITGYLCTGHFP